MEQNSKIKSFTDLLSWQHSHGLAVAIYQYTKPFPKEEIFGLTNQMRRSAVSVPSNIAEGFSRQTFKDKLQFYSIALGSLTELQSQLMIARDVGYLDSNDFNEVADKSIEARKLICKLVAKTKELIKV